MDAKSPYQGKIKIYSDGADKASLLEMNGNSKIHGMTTNPSLMKKAGVTSNYRDYCKDILKSITQKPISFEVFADDVNEMERQAGEIASWGSNVYVKIPITNSEGQSTLALVKKLAHKNVKLNITAIFTAKQVIETCQALQGGAPSIVSVFAGRIADTGRDPMPLMQGSAEICKAHGSQIELLWASTREVYNIVQAELAGCQIITAPPDIIKKMSLLNEDLVKMSLDTVRTFKKDSESAGFSL